VRILLKINFHQRGRVQSHTRQSQHPRWSCSQQIYQTTRVERERSYDACAMDLMSVQHKNAARDEGTKHSFAHCLSSSTCEQTCWLVRSAFQNRSVHNRVTASSCTAASHWCEACYLRVLYGLSGITAVKQFEFVTCDHLLSCRIKLADWCHIRSSR